MSFQACFAASASPIPEKPEIVTVAPGNFAVISSLLPIASM
jgi:hypothetical protein